MTEEEKKLTQLLFQACKAMYARLVITEREYVDYEGIDSLPECDKAREALQMAAKLGYK